MRTLVERCGHAASSETTRIPSSRAATGLLLARDDTTVPPVSLSAAQNRHQSDIPRLCAGTSSRGSTLIHPDTPPALFSTSQPSALRPRPAGKHESPAGRPVGQSRYLIECCIFILPRPPHKTESHGLACSVDRMLKRTQGVCVLVCIILSPV